MDERPATRADLVELLSALKAELRVELKAELAELRTELKTELAELRTELKTELAEIRDAVQEQIRDSQTEILKAFLPYQERTNVRFRAFEAKVSNTEAELHARMEILEARLDQIETKLRLVPPAA
jgi:vacuolar-type H+-ATPase subunit E/Vma4